MVNKVELLCPAGNFDCLTAAVQNGADAVYFAGKSFGARAFADNFDIEEIKKAIDYCICRGVKTHITVNTSCLDKELSSVLDFINFIYREGCDAVIVSDVGVIGQIKKNFPKLSVHASTQMTVHNKDGAKEIKKLGADRVVLSRELSFDDIKFITSNTDIETEIFIHGALCMSYSGQCLLSSMIGKRSGNRGSCAQPCRLPFSMDDENKKYFLSLNDLCLLNHLDVIKKSGVASLKIEGRMKGPQYVAAVTSIYRKYLDNDIKIDLNDIRILEEVFNRGGYTDGYFTGQIGTKMFSFEKPDNPYLKQGKDVKAFDIDYKDINERKLDIGFKFDARLGEKPKACAYGMGISSEFEYDKICEKAIKSSVRYEEIKTQINKTGGTPFNISNMEIFVEEDLFLSKSSLNEIRRETIKKFQENLILNKKRKSDFFGYTETKLQNKEKLRGFSVYVSSLEQLKEIKKFDFERVYVPYELIDNSFVNIDIEKVILSLPEISKDSEENEISEVIHKAKKIGIKTLLIHNFGQLKYKEEFKIVLSHRFNICNKESIALFKDYGIVSAFLSMELSNSMIKNISLKENAEVFVYGHMPLMLTENCIIKNCGKCRCNDEFKYITDRTGVKFPVKKAGKSCRNILYNSVPLYLADKKDFKDGSKNFVKNLFFTIEDRETVNRICSEYFGLYDVSAPKNLTRGYY